MSPTKILVLSDSHGNILNMRNAVRDCDPDMIFHLGDCCSDAERLHAMFPDIPMEQVRGNCDYHARVSLEELLTVENFRILLCHGHTYRVKDTLHEAETVSRERDLDLFLFGHTHVPLCDYCGKTLFLNPGSARDYRIPTYGLIRIENGALRGDLYRIPDPF